jgi:DALR anticodon binding domain
VITVGISHKSGDEASYLSLIAAACRWTAAFLQELKCGSLPRSRYGLCGLTARVLKQGLDVLGIEIVEQMQPFRAFFSFSNANPPVFESKLFDFFLAFRFVCCYL